MKRLIVSVIVAGCALVGVPRLAAAQCEGGPTITGMYGPGGVYIPTHCAYTNPTTPGQLYPSGAQPVPSTNPAAGASALPGQPYLSGLLPVNSSDLGPAPSYVSTPSLSAGGVTAPGPAGVVPAAGGPTALPGEFPQTSVPALNGNRAIPGSLAAPPPGTTTTAVTASNGTTVVSPNLSSGALPGSQSNLAYGFSLPAAPPRETTMTAPPTDSDEVIVTYPNQ